MRTVRIAFFGSSENKYSEESEIICECLFDVFDKVVMVNGGYQGTMHSLSETLKRVATEKNKKCFIQGVLFDGYKNDPDQTGDNMVNNLSDTKISTKSIGDRVQSMIDLADIVIIQNGKTGTLHELLQTIETIRYGMDYTEVDNNFKRILIHKDWEKSIQNLYFEGHFSETVFKYISNCFYSFFAKKDEKRYEKKNIFKNKLRQAQDILISGKITNESELHCETQIYKLGEDEKLDTNEKIVQIVSKINEVLLGKYSNTNQNSVVGLDIALKEQSEHKEELFRLDTVGSNSYISALNEFLSTHKSIIDNSQLSRKEWEEIDCIISKKIDTLYFHNHKDNSEFNGTEEAELKDWIKFVQNKKLGKTVYWRSVSLSNRYYISVFLLLDVYIPNRVKDEIEKIVNQFLLEDAVIKIADKNNEDITQYAKNAAIAQVLARTTSHNTGSHILSNDLTQYVENPLNEFKRYLKRNPEVETCSDILNEFEKKSINPNKKRPLEEFRIYLRQRMLLNADITSNSSKSYSAIKLGDVLKAFKDLDIVTTHISGLENCSFGGFKSSIDDIVISLPNGILGYHGLYIVFENLIRNYFKHSNGSGDNLTPSVNDIRYLYIDLKQLHGLTNDFYYSIDISDGSQINQDTHTRINDLINEPILNKNNELRSEGLGYLEIKAALCYINNIPLSEVDNPCLPEYKKEDGKDVSVFSIRSLKDDNSLRYRIFLPKPFVVKTSNSKELNKELLPKGIVDCKFATSFDSRCEFYFGEFPTNPASVSPRVALTMQADSPDNFVKSYYNTILGSLNSDVAVYALDINKTNGELLKERLSLTDNGYSLIQETDLPPEWSIFLDYHATSFDAFNKNKDTLGNLFYEGYGGQSKVGQVMNDLSKAKNEQFFIQKIIEAYFTKIIVIDERIQQYAEQKYPHSKLTDEYGETPILMFKILKMSGVIVPEKDLNKLDLNNPTMDKELFRENIKAFLEQEIKDCKLKPFVLIHLGVVEKLTENKSPESISEQIKLIKPDSLADDSIVFISERGTPKNVEQQYRFMHYSNVAKNLVEEQSKLSLTNAVFASRCLINQ